MKEKFKNLLICFGIITITALFVLAPLNSSAQFGVEGLEDNFEYWDTPQNHGWIVNEPSYPGGFPVWGMNLGPGLLSTLLDFQEGSRVLEVFYPATVTIPDIQKYSIARNIINATNPVLSLKLRAPIAIEEFDSVEIIALCTVEDVAASTNTTIPVRLIPRAVDAINPVERPEENAALTNEGLIEVKIGRENEDGTWHLIVVDLAKAINNATAGAASFVSFDQIILAGNEYRVDDIRVTPEGPGGADGPYLFHINHVFNQIFDTYQRYIYVSHPDIDLTVLPVNGNVPNTGIYAMGSGQSLAEVNFTEWQTNVLASIAGADPAITLANYQTAIDSFEATLSNGTTLADVRRAAIKAGGGDITIGLGLGSADITVDARLVYPLNVPILLVDPPSSQPKFTAYIGGPHHLGSISPKLVSNAPLDSPISYHPLYGEVYSTLTGDHLLKRDEIAVTAMALYYAGHDTWPTVGLLNIPSEQTMENLVVTVTCWYGYTEDCEIFTIQTVNYPVTNHPPVIERVDDVIFYVGEEGRYQLAASDADSFSWSMAMGGPASVRSDIEELVWTASLAGYPAYSYGPFTEPLIDQKTGLVSFTPMFEGAYDMTVAVRDPKGAEAYAVFTIFCVNPSTWLNHPPVILRDWEEIPITVAGNDINLNLNKIVDPDGERLYYSCNIGAIGYVDGEPVWTFHTEFPGIYQVEIVAYDTNGGYVVIAETVCIGPWWTY
ncbi:MAG: hypothetical protein ACMUJM_15925 [bacterium]